MAGKIRFTKAALEGLPRSTGQYDTYHDDKVSGLCVFVYPSGKKVFYFQKKVAGQKERIKIGSFPGTTCEVARDKAKEISAAFSKDQNPAAVRRALKAEPTFGEVFERFLTSKRNRAGRLLGAKTTSDYRNAATRHLASLMKLKLSSITADKFKSIHAHISSPAQANKAKAIVRSTYNWASAEGLTDLATFFWTPTSLSGPTLLKVPG